MIGSKEEFEEMRQREMHGGSSFFEPPFDDIGKENYLLSLLENTVYSASKKKDYEDKISIGITSMEEYESLKSQFLLDAKNPVTQGGNYKQKDIVRHLRKLK